MSEQRTIATSRRMGRRVLLVGASGTIGRATLKVLLETGYDVRCILRGSPDANLSVLVKRPEVDLRIGNPSDENWLLNDALADGEVDVVISCVASRTGAPDDAWQVDYGLNSAVLKAATATKASHFVLLSAICVQKPLLGFQKAKLAFESELMQSGLAWSIVRPTAFFKSLSGQFERVKAGKPFLVFGDGRLTACKPISDGDLARFIVGCIADPQRHNRILPIGGPGPALTPLDQGKALFAAVGREPRFRHVPIAMIDAIIGGLGAAGLISARARQKAELARIGRYYATESMLLLDPETGHYTAEKTPEFGSETLAAFYRDVAAGRTIVDRGDHAVF